MWIYWEGESFQSLCRCNQVRMRLYWNIYNLILTWLHLEWGFPGDSDSKKSACNAGDLDLIPGSGRSPGKGNGNPLQYSCLENSMNRRAWWATVHGGRKTLNMTEQVTFPFSLYWNRVDPESNAWCSHKYKRGHKDTETHREGHVKAHVETAGMQL